MGLKDRIRKLEGPRRPEQCPECANRIILEEIAKDGKVSYPHGEPCPACNSRPTGGRVGRIIVDARGPEDRPEERGFPLELGELSDRDVYGWPKK